VTYWESILLGFVQGVTEFLPISSDGHLLIVETILGVQTAGMIGFVMAVHVATLVSIMIAYRERLADLTRGVVRWDPAALRYVGLILLATVPAGVIGVAFNEPLEALHSIPASAGIGLLVTGTFLWTSRAALGRATGPVQGWKVALVIGIAQVFAIAPGVSRSGSTIVTALWLGVEAREAAAFSFLMAIPAIAGAAVLELPELSGAGIGWGPVLAGSLVACVTGILAIRTLVILLQRRAFHGFAPYCWAAGTLFLIWLAVR
jgi:undecaprenyl-diphosphatase